METIEKIKALGEGSHEVGKVFRLFSRGWINIEDCGDAFHVMYTSGRNTHQPYSGPAYGADFSKLTGERQKGPLDLTGAWKSSLTLHSVTDENEAEWVFAHVQRLVADAYAHNKNS